MLSVILISRDVIFGLYQIVTFPTGIIMNPNKQQDITFKIILTGDSKVGKSKIVAQLIEGRYKPEYTSTIGVDFSVQTLQIDETKVKLHIWDTSGQTKFRNITTAYYPGAQGAIIVYNAQNERSFRNVRHWMNLIEATSTANAAKLLISNRITECSQPAVTPERGKQLAKEMGARFIEVDVQSGDNIAEAFTLLTRDMKALMDGARHAELPTTGCNKEAVYQ